MATKKKAAAKKPAKTAKPKKKALWAKSAKAYAEAKKRDLKNGKKSQYNSEDFYVGTRYARSKRIVDNGQKPPKGYMRTGGHYFAKIAYMRPIHSQTTEEQRGLFYSNKDKFLGPDQKGGYLGSAANQGMYNGKESEANFRKTAGARKLIDADGGHYPPGYGDKKKKKKHAGESKRAKSRYIMAIGQDGHAR